MGNYFKKTLKKIFLPAVQHDKTSEAWLYKINNPQTAAGLTQTAY